MFYQNNNDINSQIKIAREFARVLNSEKRFEYIKLTMHDMITCHLFGSDKFLKSKFQDDTPIIEYIFTVYSDKIIFALAYNYADDCKMIAERINNEMPFLKTPINTKSQNFVTPVILSVMDNSDIQTLLSINDKEQRADFIRHKIDAFFDFYLDKITEKIYEIITDITISPWGKFSYAILGKLKEQNINAEISSDKKQIEVKISDNLSACICLISRENLVETIEFHKVRYTNVRTRCESLSIFDLCDKQKLNKSVNKAIAWILKIKREQK